ncbi:MAG: hypothetical protein KGH60_00340 [Candidatus Micrarchaeota archaeon]|nr:hypothetical protein [Candidatus Micrarchaeota archaeon]
MLYKILALTAVLAVLASSTAMASTVTLRGSCAPNYLVNQTNNYIPFNITNLGNGTATNLLIVPVLQGASTPNATISIPIAGPGSSYAEKIFTSNYTVPGSYAEYFVTRYSQGTDTFVTIYPCLINIGQRAQSLLNILNINATSTLLNVSIANIATNSISMTVAAESPPTFTISSPVRNITIGPYTHTYISFNVTSPKYTSSSFPVAVSASYVQNGIHYATLGITTIRFGAASGGAQPGSSVNWFGILIIAVIIALIILIALSVLRKRRHAHHHEHHHEEHKQ